MNELNTEISKFLRNWIY